LSDEDDAGSPIAGGKPSDASMARSAALVGQTLLGRYKIDELAAAGGLASVFRATRLGDDHEVAIKVLHPDAEGLPELVERFQREGIAGKHILHDNVVAVHEIAQLEDGSTFLVQEFVRGRTLRSLMKEGPIPAVRAARIARQLASALTAAHDFGIIHRDVKPLNIMVIDRKGGEPTDDLVKLIDFGLAKVPVEELSVLDGAGRRSLTAAGVVMGTIAYMAPEAALGMRAIDARSDLYALGVTLYEMLAGKHPFTATEPAALFAQQKNETPPRIGERSPGISVPRSLEAIVMKLLSKDPEERYPTARALIVALDDVIRELAWSASDEAIRQRGRKSARLRAVALAALVAIVLVGAWLVSTR
jgi:eukaryotic-like serine/threonine-protein kinase